MASIIGQCPECCECTAPAIEWDSRSASKTKCGFFQNIGYPTARYLKREWTGEHRASNFNFAGCSTETTFCRTIYGGQNIYDQEECGCTNLITATFSMDSTSCTPGLVINYACDAIFSFGSGSFDSAILSATTQTATGNGICFDSGGPAPPSNTTGVATETLSDEYTTTDLLANTLAALPAFDDDLNDTAGSFANLTTDELTYSIRESRYRFRFKIPKVGRGTCYKITWVERFTPTSGDPVDTERCAIWDGEVPADYDPADPDTYPIIGDGTNPYFELPIPEDNGTTTVEDIEFFCRGCAEGCPA